MLCTQLGAVALWGCIGVLPPSRAKILGVLSPSVVSATVPGPCLPESQTHLTQMVALLGGAQTFNLLHLVFLPSQRWLSDQPNFINVMSHSWAQHGYQNPIPSARSDWSILAFISAVNVD